MEEGIEIIRVGDSVSIQGQLTLFIKQEDAVFVSYCHELELTSYGDTSQEAERNLEEVIEIFFEDLIERNTLEEALEECGFSKVEDKIPHWVLSPSIVKKMSIPHLNH